MDAGTLFKVLNIQGDAANRDLAEHIHKKVDEFLNPVNDVGVKVAGRTLVDLQINPDLTTQYGRALVTVFYKEDKPKIEPKKKGR